MATAAITITGGFAVATATGAAAGETWVQSFARSGPDAPCVPPAELDIAWQPDWTGSPDWAPIWEDWANNGAGGWTCTRSIGWAQSSPEGTSSPDVVQGAGCQFVGGNDASQYVDFGESITLTPRVFYYSDPECLTSEDSRTDRAFIYGDAAQAASFCADVAAAFPNDDFPDTYFTGDALPIDGNDGVYQCESD